jgi:prepilin-type N-terminal cleavage/methylation domain-containing protein
MIRQPNAARRRAGFTLIELLVVITIIAILAALGTFAALKILTVAPDVADMHDIKELEQALGNFKVKHTIFPPDYVKLCHFEDDYKPTYNPKNLDAESLEYLQRIWPGLFKFAKSKTAPAPYNTPIPWAGAPGGVLTQLPVHPFTNQQCVILQGDQCLVFFLCGPRGYQGFAESQNFPIKDPKTFTTPSDRIRFYDILGNRLKARKTTTPPTNAYMPFMPMDEFPSFIDNSEQMPFVYFAADKKGYNFLWARGIGELGNVQPYYRAVDAKGRPTKYLNPDSFQIISAGLDGKFGPIGQWSDGLSVDPMAGKDWKDNRANFYPSQLGVEP